MVSDIQCQRCGETRDGLDASPIPGVLGERVLAHICRVCYEAWQQHCAEFVRSENLALDQKADRARLLDRFNEFFGFESGVSSAPASPEMARVVEKEREPICLPTYGPRPYWPF